jgi:hypothetical protein
MILSAIHVPLPQPDYHNIRHHDGPGEICLYHDHLLRWHPSAKTNEDVSLLHWHWVIPLARPDADRLGGDGEGQAPGPALHAHVGDWPEPTWPDQPVMSSDRDGRFVGHVSPGLSGALSGSLGDHLAALHLGMAFRQRATLGGAALRAAARTALLQRWNC